jgi:hypothetical protein
MMMAVPVYGQAPNAPATTYDASSTTGEVGQAEDGGVTTARGRQPRRERRVQEAPAPRIPVGEEELRRLKRLGSPKGQ